MSLMSRGVRNLFRNKARTAVVVLIVGFAIAIFLSASMVGSSISTNIVNLSQSLDTTIIVRPAGTSDYGMFGGGFNQETMNESVLSLASNVSDVSSVDPIVSEMERSNSTGTSGQGFRMGSLVQGMDPSQGLFLTSGGNLTISSGRSLNSGDKTALVAVIGQGYATQQGLSVGSTITLNGTNLQVVGIYTSGTTFGSRTIIIPYETAVSIYNLKGINTLYVTADSVGNMDQVVQNLQAVLGSNYDVAALSSTMMSRAAQMQSNINAVKSSSQLGEIASLLTAGAVMAFVMVLVTRERTKEIGILKAIGFKDSKIAGQLIVESIALAIVGLIIGLAIAMVAAPSLANMFTGSSPATNGGSFVRNATGGAANFGPRTGANVDVSLTPGLVLTSLVLAVGLGVVGACYPIVAALRLKPAEALRHDH